MNEKKKPKGAHTKSERTKRLEKRRHDQPMDPAQQVPKEQPRLVQQPGDGYVSPGVHQPAAPLTQPQGASNAPAPTGGNVFTRWRAERKAKEAQRIREAELAQLEAQAKAASIAQAKADSEARAAEAERLKREAEEQAKEQERALKEAKKEVKKKMQEVEEVKPKSLTHQILELAIMLAIAIILAFGIRTFLVQPFMIPTGSMIPTIEISDRVLVDKLSYHFHEPETGDIVTFPDPTGEYPVLIKRLIATEGQVIDVHDNKLYIDGKEQEEPYVHGKPTTELPGSPIQFPYTVPSGEVWVMGDNRPNSGDSRYFGAIPEASITGRAFFTYWPLSRAGSLK